MMRTTLLAAAFVAGCTSTAAPPVWLDDVDAALAQARSQRAPGVIIDVTATWCLPCKELARAYETPVMQRALRGWVRARIDVTHDDKPDFLHRWRAGTPTVLFLSPDGRELARVTEYLPPDALAARVPAR